MRGKGRDGAKATPTLDGKATHGDEPATWTRKPAGNWRSMGRLRPCGGVLGLLEQLSLAGRLGAGDAAEVGRRPGLGEAEGLGPQALVAEEAFDAFAVADQGAQLHAFPAVGDGRGEAAWGRGRAV